MLLRVACCMLLRDTQVVIRHEDCQVERSTTSNNVPLFASFSKSIAGLKLLCSLTELPKAESKIPCLLYNVISEAYSAHFNAGRNCFVSCTQAVPYSWTCRRPGQPSICVVAEGSSLCSATQHLPALEGHSCPVQEYLGQALSQGESTCAC